LEFSGWQKSATFLGGSIPLELLAMQRFVEARYSRARALQSLPCQRHDTILSLETSNVVWQLSPIFWPGVPPTGFV
jgi:hypothetical protein